jgi:hypothetical protein
MTNKKFLKRITHFLFISFIGGCGPVIPGPETEGRNSVDVSIEYEMESSNTLSCDCPASQVGFIKNHTNRKYEVQIKKTERETGEGSTYKEYAISLRPHEKKYLGCKTTTYAGNMSCQVTQSWSIKSRKKIAFQKILEIVPSGLKNDLFSKQKILKVSFDTTCRNLCENNRGDCFPLKLNKKSNSIKNGIDSIHSVLNDPASIEIKKNELTGYFGISDDPCNRSDTSILNGKISNYGEACYIEAGIQDVSKDINLSFFIPEKLEGSFWKDGSWTQIDFSSADSAIKLSLSDKGLNSEWGGVISKIEGDGKNVIAKTDNGCILVRAVN